jgi:phosphatidylglycerol:prolipoprotein diacylglycerol transferase
MHPILFHIGIVSVYSYGFFIGLGLFLASYLFLKKSKNYGYDPSKLENLIFYLFIFGIIGARVLYVILNWNYYSQNLALIVRVWEGGLVFYGGFILAFVAGIILLRKYKYSVIDVSDILAPYVVLGHAFGRIGCFLAGCCYGKETTCPLGVVFTNEYSLAPLNIKIHPTQLYEAIGNILIFFVLLFVFKKRQFRGQVIGIYLMIYPLFRFFLEFFRDDDRGKIWIFSATQMICILIFLIGIIVTYYGKSRKNGFISISQS